MLVGAITVIAIIADRLSGPEASGSVTVDVLGPVIGA
jgi:hypothetical protein